MDKGNDAASRAPDSSATVAIVEPAPRTFGERLADVVREFIGRLDHDKKGNRQGDDDDDVWTTALDHLKRTLDEGDEGDPLRAFLNSFKKLPLQLRVGDLAALAAAMDKEQPTVETPPNSNASTSSTTSEEAVARSVDKWQQQVDAAVKEILGDNAEHTVKITMATKSSYDVVASTHKDMATSQSMELKTRLDEIDRAILKRLNKWTKAMPSIEAAFVAPYIGSAHERLFRYVSECWKKYRANVNSGEKKLYRYPYCAIVQSSGFGKSRLLRELAIRADEENAKGKMRMHVLYVCVRNIATSTGYPRRTERLSSYLFPSDVDKANHNKMVRELAQRLLQVFEFAMSNEWQETSELMLGLFSGEESEYQRQFAAFEKTARQATAHKTLLQPCRLVLAVDEARTLLHEEGVGWFRVLRRALGEVNGTILTKYKSRRSGVFGIVVDTNSKVADFVPAAAQDPSHRPDNESSLFPPFVLTETIDTFYPRTKPKSEQYEEDVLRAIQLESRQRQTGWESLCSMGRPLWKTMWTAPRAAISQLADQVEDKLEFLLPRRNDTTKFAARKLLMGGVADDARSLNEDTMNGLASLLCRVGVRPYSTSPLASRAVADFMAVLSSVGFERGHYIASYSSDPILTLGAARIWHAIEPSPLAGKILPELGRLMYQELVDTGNAGEMIARIVLLLAMDACGVLETGEEPARWTRAGEFCSVWTFLRALHGDNPSAKDVEISIEPLKDEEGASRTEGPSSSQGKTASKAASPRYKCVDADPGAAEIAVDAMKADWVDWFVSFTHFVQLAEQPSEDCLWAMLARRAAGIFPRCQKGVDLVIPICTASFDEHGNPVAPRVSMILIQVKNLEASDKGFPKNATMGLRPSEVFQRGDTVAAKAKDLQALDPSSVIRIYMSLRASTTERFYLMDKLPSGHTSYVLCLNGLSAWETSMDPASFVAPADEDAEFQSDAEMSEGDDDARSEEVPSREGEAVEVLSADVVTELKKMLKPLWNVADLVRADVLARDRLEVFGESRKSLVKFATLPLAETLLLNDGEARRQGLSRLGRADPHPPTSTASHESNRTEEHESAPLSAPLSGSRHAREEDDSPSSTLAKKLRLSSS